MAGCTTCGQRSRIIKPAEKAPTGMPAMQVAASRFIEGDVAKLQSDPNSITVSTTSLKSKRTGKEISIMGPLIDSGKKPSGGWRYDMTLKGVNLVASGASPRAVMMAARKLTSDNGFQFNEAGFWVAANMQWMNNVHPKFHLVPVEDLIAITGAGKKPEPAQPTRYQQKKSHSPQAWGSRAWMFMGLYLAGDFYDQAEFIDIFRIVTNLFDPKRSPSTGCEPCFNDASAKLAAIRRNPPVNQAEARKWLWQFHNDVNKKLGRDEISFQKAMTIHHWD